MANPLEYVKAHPVTSAVIGGAGVLALVFALRGGSASAPTGVSVGPSADEIQSATQLQLAQMQMAQQGTQIQAQLQSQQEQDSAQIALANLQGQYAIQSQAADIAGKIELAQLSQQVDLSQISAQTITAQKSIDAETQREEDFYNAGIQQSQVNATLQTNLANISATSAVQQATINANMATTIQQIQAGVSNTQTKAQSKSSTLGTLGSLALGALAIFSDARLKTDIQRIGTRRDGIGIYSFRFASDESGQRYMGVLAQEVARVRPEAVVQDPQTGWLAVNYDAIGATFSKLGRFA
jgi:hypothetical protein